MPIVVLVKTLVSLYLLIVGTIYKEIFMFRAPSPKTWLAAAGLSALVAGCSTPPPANGLYPADIIDLSYWKITLPISSLGNIKEVDVDKIKSYYHPDFFYVNSAREVVFAAPNEAKTTGGSTNTRSEFRQMIRGDDTGVGSKDESNNFVITSNPNAKDFGAIGGKLSATLKVDAVSKNAGYPNKPPAYSVVVGQIHAGKDDFLLGGTNNQFGWGNEPIKIYFKKWPNHNKGSVFWTYERNLARNDPNRTDIAYPVWGNTWENPDEPGDKGIALGEQFSYEINVHGTVMYLTFTAEGHPEVKYEIDLANNVDAYGKVDELDNPGGYAKDWFYFKAGAYNQCSTADQPGMWYANCPGTGNWAQDKADGNYAQASFSRIVLSAAEAPKN